MTGLLAATVWGTGVCYMWPTMLATASERFPRGGALLMGLMGTAGTLSIQFVLPRMGAIFDSKKMEVAGGEAAFNALRRVPALDHVLGVAAQTSFRACRGFAGDFADRFRRGLVLRPVEGRISGTEAIVNGQRADWQSAANFIGLIDYNRMLQFERAEYSGGNTGPACCTCKEPATPQYHQFNGRVFCTNCRQQIEQSISNCIKPAAWRRRLCSAWARRCSDR